MKRLIIAFILVVTGVLFISTKESPSSQVQNDAMMRTTRRPPIVDSHANDPFPPPLHPIRPENLGIIPSSTPIDHPARIALAISQGDLPTIQSSVLSWFEKDPVATRDWLVTQTTYADLQPAISYITSSIAEKGDLRTALQWSALLQDGTLRDDTIFNIHALALRNGQINKSEVPLHLIPKERHDEILSGAAGD